MKTIPLLLLVLFLSSCAPSKTQQCKQLKEINVDGSSSDPSYYSKSAEAHKKLKLKDPDLKALNDRYIAFYQEGAERARKMNELESRINNQSDASVDKELFEATEQFKKSTEELIAINREQAKLCPE